MSATAGQADGVRSLADRFGIEPGMVVMEMGYDDDVDTDLRDALTDRCGELVDEDTDEVVDAVLVWHRDGDGDLFELLVDALGPLADNGVVWLLTPKAGRDGHVEPSEVAESAQTAGLQQTSTINAGRDWSGARLVMRRGSKVRLIRDNVVIHEGKLSTLKRFKDDAREVVAGQECGMSFENYQDMRKGDVIECYRVETIARAL